MPRSKTSQRPASSRTSPRTNGTTEEVRLEDIECDADGIVTKPELLAGLPFSQVSQPRKRAEWVRLRKKGWVPAEN